MLHFASLLVIGFGMMTALAALPATAAPGLFFVDLIVWPPDGAQSLSETATRLLAAISGGVLVGWGVMLWLLVSRGLEAAPELTLMLIRTSILAWFAVDSAASVMAGAPWNVLGNLVFLWLFLWPVEVLQRSAARAV